MKAIVASQFGGAEQLHLQTVDLPVLAKDEVCIVMKAAGINPSDTYTLTGTYAVVPSLPYTPGVDGAGIVEAVGEDITHVKVGDRVWIGVSPNGRATGTLAETAVCEGRFVHKLPDNVSFEIGAMLGVPAMTAYRALVNRANVQAGQTVLIHGASGGVGLIAVQMAKALGATVVGTASRPEGKEQVRAAGADYVFDHVTAQTLETVRTQLGGQGPDVIIEFLANLNLETDLQLMAKNGTIVVVGNRGTIEITPRLAMQKECAILGMILWNATAQQYAQGVEAVTKMLEQQQITPPVGKRYPLEQTSEAFQAVIDGKGNGKVVVVME